MQKVADFDIGEATGIFKYYLSQYKLYPKIVAPTAVKKLSVGKGNANKWQMFDLIYRNK